MHINDHDRFHSGNLRLGITILFLMTLLSGCKKPEVMRATLTPTSAPLFTTSTPKATPRKTSTSTRTQPACLESNGVVERLSFESELLQKPQYVRMYFPPCYDKKSETGYPVIYLLHAQTYADDQYQRLGAVTVADALISSEERPPFIMVMPFEEDNADYSGTALFNQVLLVEIIPWVDQNFATCAERACRIIDGISRGAAWAMKGGLMTPEYFSMIAAHSLPGFQNQEQMVNYWLHDKVVADLPVIWMDAGKSDYFITETRKFDALLTSLKVVHTYIEYDGNHDEVYWKTHMADYIAKDSSGWVSQSGK